MAKLAVVVDSNDGPVSRSPIRDYLRKIPSSTCIELGDRSLATRLPQECAVLCCFQADVPRGSCECSIGPGSGLQLRVWGFRVWGFGGLGFRGLEFGGLGFRVFCKAFRSLGLGLSSVVASVAVLVAKVTHRPHGSSFLGFPYRILYMNPKKELLWGLWVVCMPTLPHRFCSP